MTNSIDMAQTVAAAKAPGVAQAVVAEEVVGLATNVGVMLAEMAC